MPAGIPPLLLASIHDVSPRFEAEVDMLIGKLEPWVDRNLAMLVVPNHWNEHPIIPGSRFASKLRAWSESGFEIFLHGFFHRADSRPVKSFDRLRGQYLTAGEGEFLALSHDQAKGRIASGRRLIEDITGSPIAGFVAPAWLYGSAAEEALAECRIRLAEDHWRVWSPQDRRTLATGPVITWATRTRGRMLSSLAAAAALRRLPMTVLRIGVHPPDVGSPQVLQSIETTFRTACRTRRAGRYADLFARSPPPTGRKSWKRS